MACPFYSVVGSCRHGGQCNRIHVDPPVSPSVLIQNMYHPEFDFKEFVVDVYLELSSLGPIYDIYVAVNETPSHLSGHTYVQFYHEASAQQAVAAVNGRYYAGRIQVARLTPMVNIARARCRDFAHGYCERRETCCYIHHRNIPAQVRAALNWPWPM